jgi:hypothetical protein
LASTGAFDRRVGQEKICAAISIRDEGQFMPPWTSRLLRSIALLSYFNSIFQMIIAGTVAKAASEYATAIQAGVSGAT